MSHLSDTILCWGFVNLCLDELKKPALPFDCAMRVTPPSSHAYADPELERRCEELERRCKALERGARVPTIDWWESLEDQQRHYRSPRIQHRQHLPAPAVQTYTRPEPFSFFGQSKGQRGAPSGNRQGKSCIPTSTPTSTSIRTSTQEGQARQQRYRCHPRARAAGHLDSLLLGA